MLPFYDDAPGGEPGAYYLTRGETANAISAAVIFVLVAIVAYLRSKVYPITPRPALAASA